MCAVALIVACSAAGAATVERLSLPDMTARADQVFLGTCQSVEAVVVDGKPHTRYHFRVDQVLKGTQQDQVDVVLPGGTLNGMRLHVPGMPVFTVGEESVLFLVGTAPGPVWPAGLGQGAFRVVRGGAAKPAHVVQQLDGLSLVAARAAKTTAAGGQSAGPMTLDDLLTQVRSLVQSSGGETRAVR